jgi:hypothetical protein
VAERVPKGIGVFQAATMIFVPVVLMRQNHVSWTGKS